MTGSPPPLDPAATRGVIFDLDGTLIDSYPAIAASLNAARRAYDLPAMDESEVRLLVGHGLEALLERVLGPARVERGVTLFRETYAEVYATGTRALPGARETLCGLRAAGVDCVVASNKPARFGAPILEALGLDGLVSHVLGPDVCGSTKPDPAMLRMAMERMGLEPAETLYVGDMLLDIESAARAGVPVVLVTGGSSPATALAASGERVLDRLPELLDVLHASSKNPGATGEAGSADV